MGQTCYGWVLGASDSPWYRVTGPDKFHHNSDIAGYTAGGVMDHFSKRSSSSDYGGIPSVEQSSNDETSFQLCGRPLAKVVRFACRNYHQGRGRRSAELTSIFNTEDHKVRSRAKRNVKPSNICCRRRCMRSEIIQQFC